jgi:diacylglycerol kinase family enzyme
LAELRQQLAEQAVFWPTEKPGHAESLAIRAAHEGFRVIAAAGGDGTVHEVANGILSAGLDDVSLAVVPIGSANDYANSLGIDNGQVANVEERRVDVGVVRDSAGRQRHFVCCLGLGFNGMVTLESRKIKRLQGITLYGLATLRALCTHFACPVMEINIDNEPTAIWPTLMLSVLLGRREGGFVLAPEAVLDDGLFDYIHAGNLTRWEILRLLPRLALAGPPKSYPKVHIGRCRRIAVHSPVPLAIHTDGEVFARPEDNVHEVEIRIQPLALRVQIGYH